MRNSRTGWLLLLLLLAAPSARAADNWGGDLCALAFPTCTPTDTSRICGIVADHPPAPPNVLDGPVELSAYNNFTQGTAFNMFFTYCNITFWYVEISTTSNNPRQGHTTIYSA